MSLGGAAPHALSNIVCQTSLFFFKDAVFRLTLGVQAALWTDELSGSRELTS